MGSSPTLAAKPKCALRLVECGVKCIDKIRCCPQMRFYDFLLKIKNEFNLVGEIKFRYLLLDTVNLDGGN